VVGWGAAVGSSRGATRVLLLLLLLLLRECGGGARAAGEQREVQGGRPLQNLRPHNCLAPAAAQFQGTVFATHRPSL